MAKKSKKALGAFMAGVMSIASISGAVNATNKVDTVYAAESKALRDAKAKLSHLTKSLKTNYLGIKNQAQWEEYVKEVRALIAKIPSSENRQAKELTDEVDRDASMIQGLARINKVEKSMETNFRGIKNARQWNEYLNLANEDLAKVNQKEFQNQYAELVKRLNICAKDVTTIEDQFRVEYNFAVSLYNEAMKLQDSFKAQAALVAAEKLGSCAESDELEQNCKKLIEELTTSVASVVSAEALNGNEIVVKFNKVVDENKVASAVKLSDITFKLEETSKDGKTFTLTSNKVINVVNGVLTIEPVPTKSDANVKTKKYVEVFSYKDALAPKIVKVDAKGGKAVITFNEKILNGATLSVNGANYSNINISGKTITINELENDKTYNIQIVGAKDMAGNLADPINLKFTVEKADGEKEQTVSVNAKENKVTFKFSNEISATNKANIVFVEGKALNTENSSLILNGKDANGVKYSSDKKTVVVDAQALGVMGNLSFLRTDIKVSAVGLKNTTIFDVSLDLDKRPAKLVSFETTSNKKLILSFDEAVKVPQNGRISLALTAVDGIYKSNPEVWSNCRVQYAVDRNGKTLDDKLEVTLPSSIEFNKKYTLEVPAGISDLYDNNSILYTITTTIKEIDNTVEPEEKITTTTEVNKNIIKINFLNIAKDKGLTNDAIRSSNYTLGGKSLPDDTVVRFIDDKTHVQIVLPEGSIQTDGDYMLKMRNIRDEQGNTLASGESSKIINLVENVAPVADSLVISSNENIIITFSEAVKQSSSSTRIGGITVKVNGRIVDDVKVKLDSQGNTLTISDLSLTTSDRVYVEFKNAELVDRSKNQNPLKNSTLQN